MYRVYFIRVMFSVCIPYQISFDFSSGSSILHFLHMNPLPNKQHSTGELSDPAYTKYLGQYRGVFYKVLPYLCEFLERLQKEYSLRHFTGYSPLFLILSQISLAQSAARSWAPSDFPYINPGLWGSCRVFQRGFSRVYIKYTRGIS